MTAIAEWASDVPPEVWRRWPSCDRRGEARAAAAVDIQAPAAHNVGYLGCAAGAVS